MKTLQDILTEAKSSIRLALPFCDQQPTRDILEAALLPRVALGEDSAVNDCLERYGDLIWSLARRLLPTSADAEDVVQDIFVDIWRNAHRFDQAVASEKTFVVMLARRRLIDRQRKLGRGLSEQPLDEAALSRPQTVAPDALETEDEAARAGKCLERLKEDQRQVLELAIYHGLSQTQISTQVGLPLGTVKTHARRGMTQLRDCMKAQPAGVEGAAQ